MNVQLLSQCPKLGVSCLGLSVQTDPCGVSCLEHACIECDVEVTSFDAIGAAGCGMTLSSQFALLLTTICEYSGECLAEKNVAWLLPASLKPPDPCGSQREHSYYYDLVGGHLGWLSQFASHFIVDKLS